MVCFSLYCLNVMQRIVKSQNWKGLFRPLECSKHSHTKQLDIVQVSARGIYKNFGRTVAFGRELVMAWVRGMTSRLKAGSPQNWVWSSRRRQIWYLLWLRMGGLMQQGSSLQASISLTSFLRSPLWPRQPLSLSGIKGTETASCPLPAGGPRRVSSSPFPWNTAFSYFWYSFFQKPNLFLLDINQILKPGFYLLSKGLSLNYVSKLPDINIH